jgi:hypothetical protein
MTSARSAVLYLFVALAALAGLALGAPASDCSPSTTAPLVSSQRFQTTSSSAIFSQTTWKEFAARVTTGVSATANAAQMSVGRDRSKSNEILTGVQRRYHGAPEARGGHC